MENLNQNPKLLAEVRLASRENTTAIYQSNHQARTASAFEDLMMVELALV